MFDSLKAERLLTTMDANHTNDKGKAAEQALTEMGNRAVPTLLKCIAIGELKGKHDVATQRFAAAILMRIGGDEAIDGLIDLLNSCQQDNLGATDSFTSGRDADVRRKNNATWALAGIDGAQRAVEPIRLLLKDRNNTVRAGAMMALARTRHPQAIEILASILDKETDTVYHAPKEDFRQGEDFPSALKALEQIGPAAVDAMTQMVEKVWGYKKKNVLDVIDKMRGPKAS